jgi:hypothetical protein
MDEKTKKLLIVIVIAAAIVVGYFVFTSTSEEETQKNDAGAGGAGGGGTAGAGASGGGGGLTDALGVLLNGTTTNPGLAGNQSSEQPIKVAWRTLPEYGNVHIYALPSNISQAVYYLLDNGDKVMASSATGVKIAQSLIAQGKINVQPA